MLLTTACCLTPCARLGTGRCGRERRRCVFLIIDTGFFRRKSFEIADGGWLPLSLGAAIFLVMITWRLGVNSVRASLEQKPETPRRFWPTSNKPHPACAWHGGVFDSNYNAGAYLLIEHVTHMGALHCSVLTVTVIFEDIPRVSRLERCGVEKLPLAYGMSPSVLVTSRTDLCAALHEFRILIPVIDLGDAVYFGARDQVVRKSAKSLMPRWRVSLFAFLYRNAVKAVDRFNLPSKNFVEIGRQIEV